MIIDEQLLSLGADYKEYQINEMIFSEGETPQYYIQIAKGKAKLNNYSEKGKEFIHSIVSENESLVETSIFLEKPYPVNAVAIEDCKVLRLPKSNYKSFLRENYELYEKLVLTLSEKLHYQYMMLHSISFQSPEKRLITLMDYMKNNHEDQSLYSLQIPFTRQQLASLTALSVETVIRVIKNMEKDKILKIQNRKIFY